MEGEGEKMPAGVSRGYFILEPLASQRAPLFSPRLLPPSLFFSLTHSSDAMLQPNVFALKLEDERAPF